MIYHHFELFLNLYLLSIAKNSATSDLCLLILFHDYIRDKSLSSSLSSKDHQELDQLVWVVAGSHESKGYVVVFKMKEVESKVFLKMEQVIGPHFLQLSYVVI